MGKNEGTEQPEDSQLTQRSVQPACLVTGDTHRCPSAGHWLLPPATEMMLSSAVLASSYQDLKS